MVKNRKHYSDEERLGLVRSYYESGLSKSKFVKLHNICNVTLLSSWIKRYACEKKDLPLPSESFDIDMANISKEGYRKELSELKKQYAELEKALEISRLETKARDMLIDKAEEYFNISIRKKCGVK